MPLTSSHSMLKYIEAILKLYWSYIEAILKLCWSYIEAILKLYWSYIEAMLKLCWSHVDSYYAVTCTPLQVIKGAANRDRVAVTKRLKDLGFLSGYESKVFILAIFSWLKPGLLTSLDKALKLLRKLPALCVQWKSTEPTFPITVRMCVRGYQEVHY